MHFIHIIKLSLTYFLFIEILSKCFSEKGVCSLRRKNKGLETPLVMSRQSLGYLKP